MKCTGEDPKSKSVFASGKLTQILGRILLPGPLGIQDQYRAILDVIRVLLRIDRERCVNSHAENKKSNFNANDLQLVY